MGKLEVLKICMNVHEDNFKEKTLAAGFLFSPQLADREHNEIVKCLPNVNFVMYSSP